MCSELSGAKSVISQCVRACLSHCVHCYTRRSCKSTETRVVTRIVTRIVTRLKHHNRSFATHAGTSGMAANRPLTYHNIGRKSPIRISIEWCQILLESSNKCINLIQICDVHKLQHKLQLSIEDTGNGINFNWDSRCSCLMIAGKWLRAACMLAN